MGAGDKAQLADCLASMRPWIPSPATCKTNTVVHPLILASRRSGEEDQKFKIILVIIMRGQLGLHETPSKERKNE